MRKAELMGALAFLVVAAIAIFESFRLGFGWEKWGPQAGFVPFYLTMIMVLCLGIIIIQGLRMNVSESFFLSRPAMWSTIWVFLTSTLFAFIVLYLGMYVAIAVYAALFSAWLGRYPWHVVLAFSVIATLAVFYGMEKGLMIFLPKSPAYYKGWFLF